MTAKIIQHPASFERPEQLQMELIGQINATKFCVVPITDSIIARLANQTVIQSGVHLRVVSEIGRTLTRFDLDKAGLEPVDLQNLYMLREDTLRLKYLGVHAVSAKLLPEHCFVDRYGMVHVTSILCTAEFMTRQR